jgi:FixJ family two-component response regulator
VNDSIVFIVDDDPSFRRSSERLLNVAGYRVESLSCAQDFLALREPDIPACLVVDLRMPEMSGLELQRELANLGWQIPIIFVTGHGDVATSVRAMKAGAVEFLQKPFREQELLRAVDDALESDRARLSRQAKVCSLQRCYDSLTPREREVMSYLVAGMLNKQVAARLNVGEKTIKFHRAHVMGKMLAGSLAVLVRMAIDLGLGSTLESHYL